MILILVVEINMKYLQIQTGSNNLMNIIEDRLPDRK